MQTIVLFRQLYRKSLAFVDGMISFNMTAQIAVGYGARRRLLKHQPNLIFLVKCYEA